MFSTYNDLQKFTDSTRRKYQKGAELPWDYGLIKLCEGNIGLIEDIKNLRKPFHNLKIVGGVYGGIIGFDMLFTGDRMANRYNVPDTFTIAGGYVLSLCLNQRMLVTTDIDIFPISPSIEEIDYKHIIVDLNKNAGYTVRTERAITGKSTRIRNDIQYILCPAKTVSELLYSFDIPMCQIAIWKGEIYVTYEWIAEAYSGLIFPKSTRMSYNYHYRLKKYCVNKKATICSKYLNIVQQIQHPIIPRSNYIDKIDEILNTYTYNISPRDNNCSQYRTQHVACLAARQQLHRSLDRIDSVVDKLLYNKIDHKKDDGSVLDVITATFRTIYYNTLNDLMAFVNRTINNKKITCIMNVRDAESSVKGVLNINSYFDIWKRIEYNLGHDLDIKTFDERTRNVKILSTICSMTKLRIDSEKKAKYKYVDNKMKLGQTYFPDDVLDIILEYAVSNYIIRMTTNGHKLIVNEFPDKLVKGKKKK